MPGASLRISWLLDLPRDFGQGRKDCPDRPPVRSDGEIEIEEHLLDPHSIGVLKGPLEHRFCDLKADEAFVSIRSVAALRRLKHIESKLRLAVREGIVRICDGIAEFRAKLRVEQRHRDVGGHAVAIVVGREVRQRAQRERILVEILRLANQVDDEVAAADVMRQIAIKLAAERIISQVLDDAAAVSVGVRRRQFSAVAAGKRFRRSGLIALSQVESTIASCVRTE